VNIGDPIALDSLINSCGRMSLDAALQDSTKVNIITNKYKQKQLIS
jgi:hypothetical protein